MSWRNILLGYEPLRKAITEAERLDQGSPFEHEAINLYTEVSMRQNYGLDMLVKAEQQDGLVSLCKAEAKTAMPSLSDKELDTLAQSRISVVKALAGNIAAMTKEATDAFQNSIFTQSVTAFSKKIEGNFSDTSIDKAINDKLAQLEPSVAAAIMKGAYERLGGKKQE